jgi:predicted nucleotidyltransferase component of viral defense system
MSKDQSKNIATSIRQKLLNRSRESGEDFMLTLTRYAGVRLLYRLSCSEYADRFILKGAMLFSIWTDEPYRPTRDLDFLDNHGTPSVGELRQILSEICLTEVESDGLEFDPETIRVDEIREGQAYQGLRVRLEARLGQARIPVQADIGFGDVVTPEAVEIEFPTLLDLPAPRAYVYPRESVIAEKLESMVHLGMPNSRMKDFADIFALAKKYDFDGFVLAKAISATFKRRKTNIPSEMPLALSDEFAHEKQKNWQGFLNKTRPRHSRAEFSETITFLRKFLLPPMQALHDGKQFNSTWRAGEGWK